MTKEAHEKVQFEVWSKQFGDFRVPREERGRGVNVKNNESYPILMQINYPLIIYENHLWLKTAT